MVLVVDNYDSFVHNLARYIRELGWETHVVRNDAITLEQIAAFAPSHIVLSPGPCTPDEAGVSLDIVRRSQADHERIVDAIDQRHGTRAEMLMREHVYEAGEVLRRHWDEVYPRSDEAGKELRP